MKLDILSQLKVMLLSSGPMLSLEDSLAHCGASKDGKYCLSLSIKKVHLILHCHTVLQFKHKTLVMNDIVSDCILGLTYLAELSDTGQPAFVCS